MRRVYESSLSAFIQQNRIENITVNAPAIVIISARNAGIDLVSCLYLVCLYISI